MSALLAVDELTKSFRSHRGLARRGGPGEVRAVDEVSFTVEAGETLAVVGESGSGKSTLARCITRLVDPTRGTITFEGRDITRLRGREMRSLRSEISLVFQDPFASLDPRQKVGAIISEPIRIHNASSGRDSRSRVRELLELVGLNPEHDNRYPHQFSGGQRQRIGIARALALHPKLVVCDEPVSALDVSVQAQILNLLKDLQRDLGLTYVFISHDLSVIRYVADRVLVMYGGRVVEQAGRDELFAHPAHPYTAELLEAVPLPDPDKRSYEVVTEDRVDQKEHVVVSGCAYAPRCPIARLPRCNDEVPEFRSLDHLRQVACHYPLGRASGLDTEWVSPG